MHNSLSDLTILKLLNLTNKINIAPKIIKFNQCILLYQARSKSIRIGRLMVLQDCQVVKVSLEITKIFAKDALLRCYIVAIDFVRKYDWDFL